MPPRRRRARCSRAARRGVGERDLRAAGAALTRAGRGHGAGGVSSTHTGAAAGCTCSSAIQPHHVSRHHTARRCAHWRQRAAQQGVRPVTTLAIRAFTHTGACVHARTQDAAGPGAGRRPASVQPSRHTRHCPECCTSQMQCLVAASGPRAGPTAPMRAGRKVMGRGACTGRGARTGGQTQMTVEPPNWKKPCRPARPLHCHGDGYGRGTARLCTHGRAGPQAMPGSTAHHPRGASRPPRRRTSKAHAARASGQHPQGTRSSTDRP
jgi:hypothetical protein